MSDAASRRPWITAVIVTVLVAVLITGMVLTGGGDDHDPGSTDGTASTTEPEPVAVSSDAPRHSTLAELVEASDLVVRATVTETRRGRVFGEPSGDPAAGGSSGIESRLVGVEVIEVIAGAEPPASFYLEEEGWLLDGAPLIVDGLPPSVEGQEYIWFLVDPVTDPDQPSAFVAVNAQGRYRVTPDGLEGADLDDPLIERIEALTPEALATAVR